MDPIWTDLVIIVVLITVNAAFAGTELAVVSLRPGQIKRIAAERGRRGRHLQDLASTPTRFLSTIQVGITLAGFMASATAAVTLADVVEPILEPAFGDGSEIGALIVVTLILTFFTLVFGELVPKRIAMRQPERWALLAATPVFVVARVSRPVIWLLARTTDLFVRLLGGGGGNADSQLLNEEEVLDIIANESSINSHSQALLEGALEIQDRQLRHVLVPRRDVVTVDATQSAADAARELAAQGRSRAPVAADGDLDRVVGVTSLAALVCADPGASVRDAVTEATVLPEAEHIHAALQTLQGARRQFALVADEHGRTVGIVTVEDLLEEIVGEIYDEHDSDLAPDDPAGYIEGADGSVSVRGSYPVHDLVDLGFSVGEHDAATVGGLLLDTLGRVPIEGETAQVGDVTLEATDVEGNVINRVAIRKVL